MALSRSVGDRVARVDGCGVAAQLVAAIAARWDVLWEIRCGCYVEARILAGL